ncbi:NUDIX hydrolase [Bacillus sp. 31A1R]|uniref:NUDIX hydrolase n=1 Tax=Robertmurraya mangrovi TaxID=3098077 RepID=A0ABU5J0Z3_9BACI|nr:NUDIX hydrolase [Bacillus sp. 31A1R]MDZ5473078.1 NUDIX hydrolase [Bacillus sp. 31A1R]
MDVVFKTESGVFNFRVAGVMIRNGHILIHRDRKDDAWSLPGGRVGLGEESQVALRREFKEELGVDVKIERLMFSIENFFGYNGHRFHEVGFYYQVTDDSLPLNTDEFYGLEGDRLIYRWIPIAALHEITIYPEILKTELQNISNYPKHFVVND